MTKLDKPIRLIYLNNIQQFGTLFIQSPECFVIFEHKREDFVTYLN